ncbi:MAG: PH domain-containing protein [Clostridiales bacterium]|nr:PH domain-containing protein [Clostridiales bacterium]
MALIKCPECGAQISDKAASCPHCGAPVTVEKHPDSEGPSITCRTSPVFLVLEVVIAIVLVLVSIIILALNRSVGIVLIIVALAYITHSFLSYKTEYVSISGGTVTGHKGIIKSKKLVSPVNKVQDIGISNGLLGKIFRYHTVVVSTAGSNGAEYVFPHMANAKELQRIFVEATKRAG